MSVTSNVTKQATKFTEQQFSEATKYTEQQSSKATSLMTITEKYRVHGLLTNKNRRIPTQQIIWGPPYPPHYHIFWGTRGAFSKVVLGFRNFGYDF
jgi:hypothetical protein